MNVVRNIYKVVSEPFQLTIICVVKSGTELPKFTSAVRKLSFRCSGYNYVLAFLYLRRWKLDVGIRSSVISDSLKSFSTLQFD